MFVAGDWGTTQLRLFLCNESGVVEQRAGSGVRASKRTPAEEFASLTEDWIERHRIARAFLSGMVGSRNGWVEVPYVPCPASIEDVQRHLHRLRTRIEIAIVPGLSCIAPTGAPDVMRGEETQVFGALKLHSQLARDRHLIALPGTHTKWAEIEHGKIARFRTALAGELFAVLKAHSTLLAAATDTTDSLDDASFAEALSSMRSSSLLHDLFQVRSRQLLEGKTPAQARGWLSGILIGTDVDDAMQIVRPEHVTLIGEAALCSRYAQALALRGIKTSTLDGSECALAGLRAFAS